MQASTPSKKDGVRKTDLAHATVQVLPIAALLVLALAFVATVVAKGYRLDMYLQIVFNNGVILAIVATAATFIYTLGSFDISLGASTLFSAALGVMAYNATGSLPVMVLVIFACGIGCSLLSAALAAVFHIPVFVTTVAMMSVLSAIASQIITTYGGALGGISIPMTLLAAWDVPAVKIAVLVAFFAACVFIFDFTKVGRRQKFLGSNPVCARLTGIPLNRYTAIAFAIAGMGVAVGALLTLVYTPSVTTTTAGSIGMDIVVAIVFGGMSISGGAASRIHAALVGAFSYELLNTTLQLIFSGNTGYGVSQIVSAIFFLAVVYFASARYRSTNLPR